MHPSPAHSPTHNTGSYHSSNVPAPRAIQALTNDHSPPNEADRCGPLTLARGPHKPRLHAFGTIVKSGIIGWRNDGRR